jgi:NADH dehydrogenase [ubiquinone] 1 alpha subcomplex assembly factor 7
MNQNVFNKKGDFTTSPEISQLFGEMLGIWMQVFWEKNDIASTMQKTIIEVGPGTGKLMQTIIHTLNQFDSLINIRIIFVEVSPFLRKLQQETINQYCSKNKTYLYFKKNEVTDSLINDQKNIEFIWYQSYNEYAINVTNIGSDQNLIFLCHEFFDALPAFKFIYKNGAWHEKLIDLGSNANRNIIFSQNQTPSLVEKDFSTTMSEPNNANVHKFLKPEYRFEGIEVKDNTEFELSPLSRLTRFGVC